MVNNLATITNPSEILTLDKARLNELLKGANIEAERVQNAMDQVLNAQQRISMLEEEKEIKSRVTWWIAIVGFCFYIIPGVIYIVNKQTTKKKYEDMILAERNKIGDFQNTARNEARKCEILPFIPGDYRTPLALQTMMKYLMNGQAENWKECSLRYDEQVHRWTLEKNSAESLEIQKYTAMMTELAAKNAGRAATASTISAVSDILSWF